MMKRWKNLYNPWKEITKASDFVWGNCSFNVGLGDKALSWEDRWRGDQPLKCVFPNLYRISLSKAFIIKDLRKDSTWDLRFPRNLLNRELQEWDTLASLIGSFNPSGREDVLTWRLDKSGMFSVKSALEEIQTKRRILEEDLSSQIWEGNIPQKVKFFLWSSALNSINTIDRIQRRFPCLNLSRLVCDVWQ